MSSGYNQACALQRHIFVSAELPRSASAHAAAHTVVCLLPLTERACACTHAATRAHEVSRACLILVGLSIRNSALPCRFRGLSLMSRNTVRVTIMMTCLQYVMIVLLVIFTTTTARAIDVHTQVSEPRSLGPMSGVSGRCQVLRDSLQPNLKCRMNFKYLNRHGDVQVILDLKFRHK